MADPIDPPTGLTPFNPFPVPGLGPIIELRAYSGMLFATRADVHGIPRDYWATPTSVWQPIPPSGSPQR